ncbi:MAG: cytochrome c [Gammaproteobacteria bacterium]|nr:cytochrome c [Gammaproteobacteria bacterium]
MNTTVKGIAIGAFGMVLLLIAIALIVVLTGSYNVAATDRHSPIVGWALTTTMKNSVESRARGTEVPEAFTADMITAGASEYKAMCSRCHGGVGESRQEWAGTMRPTPPALAQVAYEWTAEEVFWLVKHGVKMTGMPAFGSTHDDETIWTIAAFVKALPDMSAEQYAAYDDTHGEEGAHDHEHASGHETHDH